MSVTHVAGPAVCIGGRFIQRCAVCGEKLIDSLGEVVMVVSTGSVPQSWPTWQEAGLVQCDGNRQTATGMFTDQRKPLPEDFCLTLVER